MGSGDADVPLGGDSLRVFAGQFVAGEIQGKPVSQGMWVLIAALMLIPISCSSYA